MRVTEAIYATPECRNVAIGHAIEALHGMSGQENGHRVRPATRRKAERFVASTAQGSVPV